jgi:tRNA(fMet)-specific endonuclease VapC
MYMLDTNICIFLMKNSPGLVRRYAASKSSGVAVSAITLSELQFGVHNSSAPGKNGGNLYHFLIGLDVSDLS